MERCGSRKTHLSVEKQKKNVQKIVLVMNGAISNFKNFNQS